MIDIIDKILQIIYPPVCGVCQKLDNNYLCNKCAKILKKQAIFGIDDYSKDTEKYFDEHLYIFIYDGIIRKVILNYKFNSKSYLYKTFVKFLLKNQKFVEIIKTYDIMIPVSLSWQRQKERGYNQSTLISKEISRSLKVCMVSDSLYKVKDIMPQSSLNKIERENNIQGVYTIKSPKNITNKKIL